MDRLPAAAVSVCCGLGGDIPSIKIYIYKVGATAGPT